MSEENKKTNKEKKTEAGGGEAPSYVRQYVMRKAHKRTYEDSRPEPVFTQPRAVSRPVSAEEQIAEELESRRKRQKAKKLLFVCIIVFILLLLYPLFRLVSNSFVISEIIVEGECRYSAQELLAASGLVEGEGLFGNDLDGAAQKALDELPYLRSCRVETALPDKIIFTVASGEAVIYTEVAGEYYALSAALRVLERRADSASFASEGLVFAILPSATTSVVGEYVEFSDGRDGAYITDFLDALAASPLGGRVNVMFLEEKFDMVLSVDGQFRVKLGSAESAPLKLGVADRIIAECGFTLDEKGVIDVTDPERPTSLKKNDIDIGSRSD